MRSPIYLRFVFLALDGFAERRFGAGASIPATEVRTMVSTSLRKARAGEEIVTLPRVSPQTLYDVSQERRLVTLGKLRGNGPDLWLNLQKRYDLHQAERELGAKIKMISDLGSRLSELPSTRLSLIAREEYPRCAFHHVRDLLGRRRRRGLEKERHEQRGLTHLHELRRRELAVVDR
jgi:hypothetical protein